MEIASCLEVNPKTGEVIGANSIRLADWVLEQISLVCVVETGELLMYHKGRYVPNGQEMIHGIMVEALKEYTKHSGQAIYSRHLFGEVIDVIKGKRYKPLNAFDQDPHVINMQNGLYNTKTMELKPHSPEYHSRVQIPVAFDKDATCPTIEKICSWLMRPEDLTKAYEFIGYCLYKGYPLQKMFLLFGPGGTGKSIFIKLVRTFLGEENCSAASLHDLATDRFASSDLYGKLMNECADIGDELIRKTGHIKSLVGDGDKIRAQRKNERAFGFHNHAKLLFSANALPPVRDDTTGWYRRPEIIPFMRVITSEEYTQHKDEFERMASVEELSGLFNKVVSLLNELLRRGKFTNETDWATTEQVYKAASNPAGTFLDMFVSNEPNAMIEKRALYDYYSKFCEKIGARPLTMIRFSKYINDVVGWCPRCSDPSKERANLGGKTAVVWRDTYFDVAAWAEWEKTN